MDDTLKLPGPPPEQPSLVRVMIMNREQFVEHVMQNEGFGGPAQSPEESQAQSRIRDFIRVGFDAGFEFTLKLLQERNAELKRGKIILDGNWSK